MARKIFIDTDCGIDDAVAIMMALSSPEVEVTGISCVAGNTSLENVLKNVCGLPGNVELDAKGKAPDYLSAPEGILAAAEANPGLQLVALGPLTNIAVAFNLYPELTNLVSEIIIMGGALARGNVTPWADFYAMDMAGNPAGDLFNRIQTFYLDFMEKAAGRRIIGFPDPLTMACVIDPSVAAETEKMHLCMVLSREEEKRGASVRVSDSDSADGTAEVIMKCKQDRFIGLLKRIKTSSPLQN